MTYESAADKIEILATLTEAARISGAILHENFGKSKEIMYKGRIDPVTSVDLTSERAIVGLITSRHPGHDIITEESKPGLDGSRFRWIIDPIDGTVNYAHDYPVFAVSIGFEADGVMEAGVVYNPVRDEFFHAVRGEGAFLNGTPIHVSAVDTLERSLLVTGFPYDIRENPRNNLSHFGYMSMKAQAVRRDGSAALNLCYTAMGRFDGYWELTIAPWDVAAGALIVTEAGGMVTRLDDSPFSVYDRQILASNGRIHNEFVREIRNAEENYREHAAQS